MPDHLARAETADNGLAAAAASEKDPDLQLERAWLASCIRLFVDCDITAKEQPKPGKFRLATYWWLVTLDTVLRQYTTQGLEAFASQDTAIAVEALLRSQATPEAIEKLVAKLRSDRFELQWLALPVDQCSIGMSGQLAAKRLFKLLVEAVYDPAHLRCNTILGALKQSGQFQYILVMKVMYLETVLTQHKSEVRELWNYYLPAICHDLGMDSASG